VVCGMCSHHRIPLPNPFIVRAPWETPAVGQQGGQGGHGDFSNMSGGQTVRLCNTCVEQRGVMSPQYQYPTPQGPANAPGGFGIPMPPSQYMLEQHQQQWNYAMLQGNAAGGYTVLPPLQGGLTDTYSPQPGYPWAYTQHPYLAGGPVTQAVPAGLGPPQGYGSGADFVAHRRTASNTAVSTRLP
jgi:hypothetical protein